MTAQKFNHTLTLATIEAVATAVRQGAVTRDAFEANGIPGDVGAYWLRTGRRAEEGLEFELVGALCRARAEARMRGSAARTALTLRPLEDDDARTGIERLAARAEAAQRALSEPLDAPAAFERVVQIMHAVLELLADMLSRQDELTIDGIRELRGAIRDAGKLHEQLAAAEKNRAQARASETVEMFVVASMRLAARVMTADQIMLYKAALEQLPAVSGVFGDDTIIDVTPAPPPEEPAEITEPDGLTSEEVFP